MSNLSNLKAENARPDSNGLAPVACYDPYYGRMMHGLKKCLSDGFPVLARLHSAAQYPAEGATMYQNDLEGHAVLFTGYDDQKKAFAVWDPWNNQAADGFKGGSRWIGYNELALEIVDCSKDFYLIASPLVISAVENQDNNLSFAVGYYAPDSIVMDRDNQEITEMSIEFSLPEGWSTTSELTRTIEGSWKVGEFATFDLPLDAKQGNGELVVTVKAKVSGQRPYQHEDWVSTTYTHEVTGNKVQLRKVA